MKLNLQKKTPGLLLLGAAVLVIAGALLLFGQDGPASDTPTLTVETPQKLSSGMDAPFTLEVGIDHLGNAIYPAVSMSLAFDPSMLEFLGVEEGNVFIHNSENNSGRELPQWSVNVENSNQTGIINIMYLDMTGGKHAFSQELLAEEDNVVLRLAFRLRGSVRKGDVLDLVVEDAVFAASDESQSLAVTQNTLKVKNSKIVVGE